MKDARFEELRTGIYQELLKANQHFKIYWGIRSASSNVSKIMNVYITFFYYTMRGNDDGFCLAIYNVIKCDDDTANFQKLFNYIKSSRNLGTIFDRNYIEEMEKNIESQKGLIERIKTVRDQYIAHNQLSGKNLKERSPYTYEEGRELLKDLNNMLNGLSNKYDGLRYWQDAVGLFDVSPGLDLEDMLHDLTEYRKESTKRRLGGALS